MSTRLWRCRNPHCLITHGAILGRLTVDDGLVLDPESRLHAVFLDTRRAVIVCPACGQHREFRGGAIHCATS
jgi:hypothetical protein